jgi:hypothetical protein
MACLGAVPTQTRIIAERFFDEAGGMQLVLHAPFGARMNRALGLALRKRFCVSFDFELQAAATDDGIVLSLGEQHSFPLPTCFRCWARIAFATTWCRRRCSRRCLQIGGGGTRRARSRCCASAAARRCRSPCSECAPKT